MVRQATLPASLSGADRRELEAIEQLCDRRYPRDEFLQAVSARLCRHVGADASCFSLLDPVSGLPAEVVSPFDEEARRTWIESVFLRTPLGDMGWLSRQPQRIQTAAQFVAEPERDPLMRKLLLPYGMTAMVCVSLVDAGTGWGYVNLMRRTGAAPFGDGEKRFLAAVTRPIAAELRRRAAHQLLSALPATEIGIVTIDAGGAIDSMNDVGESLMTKRDTASFPLAVAVMGQLLRRTILEGRPAPAGTIPIVDATGKQRYRVRAQLLVARDGRRSGAVIAEPLRALNGDGTLLQLGLTRRETDVAAMTMRGLSTQDTGTALGLAAHTVEHHLGNIFDKLRVGSRAEMTALLLGGWDAADAYRTQARRPARAVPPA